MLSFQIQVNMHFSAVINMLPISDTSKTQETQWICGFPRLTGHQLGKNLEYSNPKLQAFFHYTLKCLTAIRCLLYTASESIMFCRYFFLNRHRVSRSMDYHYLWLLVRKIIYNKYRSCLSTQRLFLINKPSIKYDKII